MDLEGVQPLRETDDHLEKSVWDLNWDEEYEKCPQFMEWWKVCHTPLSKWPEGVKIFEKYMYFNDKLCVPKGLQEKMVMEHHKFLAHVGGERLFQHLQARFSFFNTAEAKKFANRITNSCETCQACQRTRFLRGPIESTPVPLPS